MAQLTGIFQGTSQADSFLGETQSADAILIDNNNLLGIAAAEDLNLKTLGGNDIVSAITDVSSRSIDLVPSGGSARISAFGIAMDYSYVNTGKGDDSFTATSRVESGRRATSIGLRESSVETKAGNDSIVISSDARTADRSTPPAITTGMINSFLYAGTNNDTITVRANSNSSAFDSRALATATGLESSGLFGQQGQDTIQISTNAVGAGLRNSSVSAVGISMNSRVSGGSDDDILEITSFARMGNRNGGGSADSTGVATDSWVLGGKGADTITISASVDANGVLGATGKATGVSDSSVYGNGGDDIIDITAKSIAFKGTAVGMRNSSVEGGAGDDTITIDAQSQDILFSFPVPTPQNAYGAVDSFILGGAGNDSITIRSTYTKRPRSTPANDDSVGLVNTTVRGGAGDDTLTVSGLNLDLQDAVISGGSGEDFFDTGMGSAEISGGSGYDTLKLDFFDGATMSITQLGTNGLQIVGTQDKQGNSNAWTQIISNVESYEVAGTVYSAADVVNLLS